METAPALGCPELHGGRYLDPPSLGLPKGGTKPWRPPPPPLSLRFGTGKWKLRGSVARPHESCCWPSHGTGHKVCVLPGINDLWCLCPNALPPRK